MRRVTASCGGLGSVWQYKVGSGAARFGKTVGARFGKVSMFRCGMAWIGGLGEVRLVLVGRGLFRRLWYGALSCGQLRRGGARRS